MAQAPMSDEKIRETIHFLNLAGGNRTQAAKLAGLNTSTFGHRLRLAKAAGLDVIDAPSAGVHFGEEYAGRATLEIENGIVLVGSDCHYWNRAPSTAHRAMVKLAKEFKPKAIIMNGDVLDGASISRHPPLNWESRPSLIQEIEACQERLGELEKAAEKAERVWTLGNHDARFEQRLATVAPEYARVKGVHLKDHFNHWEPAWSCWINEDLVIKHRFKSGIHAPHNNTVWAGKSMVTGHLHSAKVMPITDYNGTRWGVDTGCIADPFGPQFEYAEDNPRNWRSAFGVFTFWHGRLLWPEIVHVIGPGQVEFRGRVIDV